MGQAKGQLKSKTSICGFAPLDGWWMAKKAVKKAVEEDRFDREDHKFSFKFVEFELFLRHTDGEAKKIIGFKNLELRVTDINLI